MAGKRRQEVEIPHLDIIAEQEFRDVPLDELDFTEEYQRSYSPAKAKAIAEDLHPLAAREIVVAVRSDGKQVIIDGRHTVSALRQRGYKKWRCQLIHGLTLAEESRLFWYLNTKRANPKAIETWKSRRVFGDPIVKAVEAACADSGFEVCKTSGPGRTASVRAIEAIFKNDGAAGLRVVLDMARGSWPEDHRHGEGKLLHGIAIFLRKTGSTDKQRVEIVRKWGGVPLDVILRRARSIAQFEGGSAPVAMACSLLETYNKSRTTRRLRFTRNGDAD